METRGLVLATPLLMELVCNGDCFKMLLGRSFTDFVRELESKLRRNLAEELDFSGTAGAMEKEAALNVAIRMGLCVVRRWN